MERESVGLGFGLAEENGVGSCSSQRKCREVAQDSSGQVGKYEVGEMVLTRIPGMINKLDHAWDGPFEVPNDVHLVLSACGKGRKKGRRVHVNLCKPYSASAASVHRLVVSAEDDPELETPKTSLLGKGPTGLQQKKLDDLLGQFGDVLTDKPGRTCILHHEVNTGGSPPIRSAPYQVAERLRESVKKELEGLCEMGILEPSVSPWSSPIVPVAK